MQKEREKAENDLKETIHSWEEKCSTLEKELKSTKISSENKQRISQAEIDSLKTACEAEKKARNDITRKLMQAISNHSSAPDLITEVKELKQSLGDYESKLEEVDEEKRGLQGKLEEVQRSLGLEATLAKNKRDSLQRQLSETVKEKEGLQASLEDAEDNIKRLETIELRCIEKCDRVRET